MVREDIVIKINDYCNRVRAFGITFPSQIERYRPGDALYKLQNIIVDPDNRIRLELIYPSIGWNSEEGKHVDRVVGCILTFSDVANIIYEVIESKDSLYRVYRLKNLHFIECKNLMVDNLVPEIPVVTSTFYEIASTSFSVGESEGAYSKSV